MNTMDTFHQMDKSHQGYITEFNDKSEFEQRINTAWRRAEPEAVEELLQAAAVSDDLDHKIYDLAFNLAHNLRERKTSSGKAGIVQGLLQEFSLSSQEGVALMCVLLKLCFVFQTQQHVICSFAIKSIKVTGKNMLAKAA